MVFSGKTYKVQVAFCVMGFWLWQTAMTCHRRYNLLTIGEDVGLPHGLPAELEFVGQVNMIPHLHLFSSLGSGRPKLLKRFNHIHCNFLVLAVFKQSMCIPYYFILSDKSLDHISCLGSHNHGSHSIPRERRVTVESIL